MRIETHEKVRKEVWRHNGVNSDDVRGYTLAQGNGTTEFGLVKAGTFLGLLANGKVRPGLMADIAGQQSSTNALVVTDADNAYVGDVVDIKASKYSARADEVSFQAGDTGETITVTAATKGDSRLRVILTNPGADAALSAAITDDGTNFDVNITLRYSAAAIQTDVQELLDFINGELSWLMTAVANTTAAETCQAVSATALTGGYAEGDAIATGRTVTAVDKATKTITIGGAAISVEATDVVQVQDGWNPVGICEDQLSTVELRNGALVGVDRRVTVALAGHAKQSKLIGYSNFYGLACYGGVIDSAFAAAREYLSHFTRVHLR